MKKKIENSNAVTAIYVRRSVADRDNNSLSIESQKEDCIKYIGEDCVYRIYCDNGFFGKNIERRHVMNRWIFIQIQLLKSEELK